MAMLEEAALVIRDLAEGRRVELRGHRRSSSRWAGRYDLPLWIAGYGPKAHGARRTDRRRDDAPARRPRPHPLVRRRRSTTPRVPPAATRARSASWPPRRPTSATSSSAANGRAGSRRSVSNHVVDLVNRYPPTELPPALTGYIRDRTGYDYHHHAEVGSTNAGVRRRRGDRPVLRARLGRRPRREAARAGRRRRRPVQHLPDERRRGGRCSRRTRTEVIPALRDVVPVRGHEEGTRCER